MGSGYGLAALAGILGGIGTGGYKGIDAGIEDRLNQDKLAETKRQFDEGRFTDMSTIPPALRAALGLTDDVTGKVHASLVPSILSAADKAQTARTTAEKNTRVGDALENNTFGRAGDVPVSAQAPGMLAPDARVPDPQIAALGPIARAGEADRSMGVLSELLKQRAVGDNPKVTTTYKDARDESGENRIFALSHDARGKHLGSQDTGLRSAGSKSSLDAAITAFQSNPTPENLQRLNALAGFVPIAPG
jgi:hypothetical protein